MIVKVKVKDKDRDYISEEAKKAALRIARHASRSWWSVGLKQFLKSFIRHKKIFSMDLVKAPALELPPHILS